jgi:hypothetical protein
MDFFVPPGTNGLGSDGLNDAGFMTFTETDPATLEYNGRETASRSNSDFSQFSAQLAPSTQPHSTGIDAASFASNLSVTLSLVPSAGLGAGSSSSVQSIYAGTVADERAPNRNQPTVDATLSPRGTVRVRAGEVDQVFTDFDASLLSDSLLDTIASGWTRPRESAHSI